MTTKDTIEDKMEQILETFGDRVADKFGGSWDDLSPKAQVELYGEFYDSLLDIFSKALNEARVNAKIEILAHVLVHQATGRKHIGLSRPGVVSVLADLQAERQEIWESKPKKDIEG